MASSQVSKEPVKNPYISRGAIQDPRHFFGRVQETREILDLTSGGQSVSIVGPRRIGKTSLLLHVRRSAPPVEAGKKTRHLYVFLDLQRKPQASRPEICQWMWNETLGEAGPVKGLPTAIESDEEFMKAVGKLCAAGFRLTLLVDEFELMAQNPQIDFNFFSRLCSLSAARLVSYVITSRKPLFDLEYSDPSVLRSSFFTVFHQQRLGFLTQAEARELICKPVENMGFPGFAEEEIRFLFDLAGYHPALLQIACYFLFEHKTAGRRWDEQAKSEVRQRFRNSVSDYLHQIWRDLKGDEQEAMRLICAGQTDNVGSQLWDSLAHQCLVYERKPSSSVFKEFVLQGGRADRKHGKKPPPTIPDESPTSENAPVVTIPEERNPPPFLDLSIGGLLLINLVSLLFSGLFMSSALLYVSAISLVIAVVLALVRSYIR